MKIRFFSGIKQFFNRRVGAFGAALMVLVGGAAAAKAEKPAEDILAPDATIEQTTNYVSVEPKIVAQAETDPFFIGYHESEEKTHLLAKDVLTKIMENAGAEITYDKTGKYPTYKVQVGDETYTYSPGSGKFTSSKGSVYCRFYATNDELANVDNVILAIGGSGSHGRGENMNDIFLSPNSVVINTYIGEGGSAYASADVMVDCAKFANATFAGKSEKVHNVITGFSEGAQVAFIAVARNPEIFQTLICSNGTSYWSTDKTNVILKFANDKENPYGNLRGINYYFLESKDNHGWGPIIDMTVQSLVENDVPVDNIRFFTNDPYFVEQKKGQVPVVKSILDYRFHFLEPDEEKFGLWRRHGSGQDMINQSGILDCVSSKPYVNKYAQTNPCFRQNQYTAENKPAEIGRAR